MFPLMVEKLLPITGIPCDQNVFNCSIIFSGQLDLLLPAKNACIGSQPNVLSRNCDVFINWKINVDFSDRYRPLYEYRFLRSIILRAGVLERGGNELKQLEMATTRAVAALFLWLFLFKLYLSKFSGRLTTL